MSIIFRKSLILNNFQYVYPMLKKWKVNVKYRKPLQSVCISWSNCKLKVHYILYILWTLRTNSFFVKYLYILIGFGRTKLPDRGPSYTLNLYRVHDFAELTTHVPKDNSDFKYEHDEWHPFVSRLSRLIGSVSELLPIYQLLKNTAQILAILNNSNYQIKVWHIRNY